MDIQRIIKQECRKILKNYQRMSILENTIGYPDIQFTSILSHGFFIIIEFQSYHAMHFHGNTSQYDLHSLKCA